MLRYLLLSALAAFVLTSSVAQTYEKAVFTHRKDKKTEITFKKGQKVKVVWLNPKGVTYEYKGRLVMISQDTISLDRKKYGEVALPVSRIVKIQRAGIPAVGWVLIGLGVLLMAIGLLSASLAGFEDLGQPTTSKSGDKKTGLVLALIGLSMFLGGFFVKHPSVSHLKENWEMRTEIPLPQQNPPNVP